MKMRSDVPPFAMIFRADLETAAIRNLSGSEFRIWVALCSFCSPGAEWHVSVSLLEDVTGFNRRTIQRALATLERSALIVKVNEHPNTHKRGGHAPNTWTVKHPGVAWKKTGRSDDRSGGRSGDRKGGRSGDRPRGRREDRSQKHTPSVENGPDARIDRAGSALWALVMDPETIDGRRTVLDNLCRIPDGSLAAMVAEYDDARHTPEAAISVTDEHIPLGASLKEWTETITSSRSELEIALLDGFEECYGEFAS